MRGVNFDEFNAQLCAGLREWFCCAAPVVDDYYQARVAAGDLLIPTERAIAAHIAATAQSTDRLCEIGGGFGQLSLLLAAMGFPVALIEATPHRLLGCRFLANKLGLRSRMIFVHGWFPMVAPTVDAELWIATNTVGGFLDTMEGTDEKKLRELLGRRTFIFDARTWWAVRESPDAQADLVRSMERCGRKMSHIEETVWRADLLV